MHSNHKAKMGKVINIRETDRIEDDAARWIVRLDGGSPDEETIDAFSSWLEQDQRHRARFVELASLWGNMDSLSTLANLIPLNETGLAQSTSRTTPAVVMKSRYAVALVGMFVAISVGVMFYFGGSSSFQSQSRAFHEVVYQTAVGSQEEFQLPDKSVIKLNTDTQVLVSYNEYQRNVVLQKGEAYFQVSDDPRRPFSVFVGQGKVVAVGTAFNIRMSDDLVRVIVTDGKVEVFPSVVETGEQETPSGDRIEATYEDRIFLTEGNSVEFDSEIKTLELIEPEDIDHGLAWQKGMISFEGESLEAAINEINRYTSTRIVITDSQIRKIRVGGYFNPRETQTMLDACESIFGLQLTHVSEDLIHISRKSSTP